MPTIFKTLRDAIGKTIRVNVTEYAAKPFVRDGISHEQVRERYQVTMDVTEDILDHDPIHVGGWFVNAWMVARKIKHDAHTIGVSIVN